MPFLDDTHRASSYYRTLAGAVGVWRMARVVACSHVTPSKEGGGSGDNGNDESESKKGHVTFTIRWLEGPDAGVAVAGVAPSLVSFFKSPTGDNNAAAAAAAGDDGRHDYSCDAGRSLLRTVRAAVRRRDCEAMLRFHLFVDCVPSSPKTVCRLTDEHL